VESEEGERPDRRILTDLLKFPMTPYKMTPYKMTPYKMPPYKISDLVQLEEGIE
jgi:hypothetical protein